MGLTYIADQGIRASHHSAAAESEQEQQQQDATEARRARQGEERDGDEGKAEDEAELLAFVVKQRPDAERSDDEPQRLRKGDGAVLARRQVEAIGQVGQDGAQHGGDHPVDEKGENGGEY